MISRTIYLLLFLITVPTYSQNSLIIKLKDDVLSFQNAEELIKETIETTSGNTSYHINYKQVKLSPLTSNIAFSNYLVLSSIQEDFPFESVKNNLPNSDLIEHVDYNNIYKIDSVPNDSLYSEQWYISTVQADKAFEISSGSTDNVIGVIDTGIDYFHPDLINSLYINYGETGLDSNGVDKSFNGIDDDKNGYIDDYRGGDFVDKSWNMIDSTDGDYFDWDNDPFDENGHGTNIAGIIGAEQDNLIGIAGIAPGCKILNLRAFDKNGYGEEDDAAAAIIYAVDIGVKIINMSFGDAVYSHLLEDVIDYAHQNGVVLIGSAGNSSTDIPHYPSGFSQVISVNSTDANDNIASFSNFGNSIDLSAPGADIITTNINNSYKNVSGTSISAPFVSAAAALLLSQKNYTSAEIKQILKSTSEDIVNPGYDYYSGAGRLNLYRALLSQSREIIEIHAPQNDYHTASDSIMLNVSVLSSEFSHFKLDYGIGDNPINYSDLVSIENYQLLEKDIYHWDVRSLADTVFTLRLSVTKNNGTVTREFSRFQIDRSAPKIQLLGIGPVYEGLNSSFFTMIGTDDPSIAFMHYRKTGDSDFKKASMDGLQNNIYLTKNIHYCTISEVLENNTIYEVFFTAENKSGRSSTLIDNGGNYFRIKTARAPQIIQNYRQTYSLPLGTLYEQKISFFDGGTNQILLNTLEDPRTLKMYNFDGKFTEVSSLMNRRIPKAITDINNNFRNELISYLYPISYIDEQEVNYSSNILNIYKDSTNNRVLIDALDYNQDGQTEIFFNEQDSTLVSYQIREDFTMVELDRFENNNGSMQQLVDHGNIINITDLYCIQNSDGTGKIYFSDYEGDIIIIDFDKSGAFTNNQIIRTFLSGADCKFSSLKYNDQNLVAVLLHTPNSDQIQQLNLLYIFDPEISFIEPIEIIAFNDPIQSENLLPTKAKNNLSAADLNGDGIEELIISIFPNTYFLDFSDVEPVVTSYFSNGNLKANEAFPTTFIGDLNSNGVLEISIPENDSIYFYEFDQAKAPSVPIIFEAYSYDTIKVLLNWLGDFDKSLIYKKTDESEYELFDSTIANEYIDSNTILGSQYSYYIVGYNNLFEQKYSVPSRIINITPHIPIVLENIDIVSGNSLKLSFSGKIDRELPVSNSILINGKSANSVGLSSEKEYFAAFSDDFKVGKNLLELLNLIDYFGSPIQDDSTSFIYTNVNDENNFYISRFQILNENELTIEFNQNVDSLSVVNKSNYSFNPSNFISSIRIDTQVRNKIFLQTEYPIKSIGKQYQLTLTNIYSDDASGNRIIREGSGSTIVLNSFAENLADVFVYPNPVKVNNTNSGKIIFANLTENAEIIIFDINGNKISTLSESDGNGGVEWDLKNDFDHIVGSGIYIYIVRALNEEGSEIDRFLGKFAVLK
ncbi:MAG: S8 family serine peptidase [Melioribacteraceae bacterium]|nr:S8 family serine peptidase [Melioribacteraceae bacterium]MCF8352899.1 S8 family serine peptidase [Melioribacteraceae bacterium]MCF8393784.1 S8 family serine peptidase [Melioribacteraceae bacterium]MCF8417416.1 S8 family serine peptidase [Melioribacteraceae bacterium]